MHAAILFCHPEGDPYWQMACDEWLLQQVRKQPGRVFLRLYTWSAGTITIGYHQRLVRAVDTTRLENTPVIRRITGGRAVYHLRGELTYAVAANPGTSSDSPLGGGLSQSGRTIALVLQAFLSALDIDAKYARSSAPSERRPDFLHTAPCFASVSRYELTSQNRKVVASAQKRVGRALLQHGAIKLDTSVTEHPALGGEGEVNSVVTKAVTVPQLTLLAPLFARAWQQSTGQPVEIRELLNREQAAVDMRRETVATQPLAQRSFH